MGTPMTSYVSLMYVEHMVHRRTAVGAEHPMHGGRGYKLHLFFFYKISSRFGPFSSLKLQMRETVKDMQSQSQSDTDTAPIEPR